MPQFLVHVYRSEKGYRVVGGGLVHFDVERSEEVEPSAREAILNILRAAFPDRSGAPADPTAERTLWYEIELRRVDPVPVPPPETTEEAPLDAQDRLVVRKGSGNPGVANWPPAHPGHDTSFPAPGPRG